MARLLAKMEQAHATFATRAELDELRKLVNALREELDALGVRVDNLEENVSRLDKRVTELERISFYGYLETRIVSQSFNSDGANDNDANRGSAGAPGTVPYLNYNSLVGSRTPAPFRPQVQGIIPTDVDYRNGREIRPAGTGIYLTSSCWALRPVSPSVEARSGAGGLRLARRRGGRRLLGVLGALVVQSLDRQRRSSAATGQLTIHPNEPGRFWVSHKAEHGTTRVMVGNIDKTETDGFVYAGQPNIGVFGPRRWPGYGFQVQGD